jgi:hypothetical protein
MRASTVASVGGVLLMLAACDGSTRTIVLDNPTRPSTGHWISISPTSADVCSLDLNLTITGTAFAADSQNYIQNWTIWMANGTETALPTTLVDDTRLTAMIPAALLVTPGTAEVFVRTADPQFDGHHIPKSNSELFTIRPFSPRSGVVVGIVTDPSGRPLSDVSVEWTGGAEDFGDRGDRVGTDRTGAYRIVVWPFNLGSHEGLFFMRATKAGYVTSQREVRVGPTGCLRADFALTPETGQ